MHWYLPERRKNLIRNYSRAILDKSHPASERHYILYLLLRPVLEWAVKALQDRNLEKEEAENEIYLMVYDLFKKYDRTRSSLSVYIERQIVWAVSAMLDRHTKYKDTPVGLDIDLGYYEMPDEIYLSIPNFLIEKRWLAKDLSFSEKNLILNVLTADSSSCRTLTDGIRDSKSTINNRLNDLSDKLKGRF